MKFSYTLLKQFVPKLKSKAQAMDLLSTYSFEAEEAAGNTIEVKIPANRYSDASSHVGIARELSAALDEPLVLRDFKNLPFIEWKEKAKKAPKKFTVTVQDETLCPRYSAQYFEHVKIGPSPKWLQTALTECGLRPINNVVDIMNYVMIETGQPLHAFDFDKLSGKGKPEIIVRRAKKGEHITSIDGVKYSLTTDMLVIADPEKPLAIAGIKGGTGCEVTETTTRILVEAANFDGVSIMKTSRKLGLTTDASQRFSHNISASLTEAGLNRAAQALQTLADALPGERFDSLAKPVPKKVLVFDVEACNKLLGTSFSDAEAAGYLRRLQFKNTKKNLWDVPQERTDIETNEDLSEEVIRMYGIGKLKASAPHVPLMAPVANDLIATKTLVRNIVRGFGVDEVYNHTFISKDDIARGELWKGKAIALENPVSSEFEYLRPLLAYSVGKNVDENFRYYDTVRIFEIGNVFRNDGKQLQEHTHLCVALGTKGDETFFEMKGMVVRLLEGLGLADITMKEVPHSDASFFIQASLEVKAGGALIGYLGFSRKNVSIAEFNLDAIVKLVEGEREYEPLQKYPEVMRDVSMFISLDTRIGEVMRVVEEANERFIVDVDLVDEYVDDAYSDKQSITLRVVFQAKDRTLTSDEVDAEMKRIREMLATKFKAQLR